MYIFGLWWANSPILPDSCKCGHFMELTAFIIQYERSLRYCRTVMNFSSPEAYSGVEIMRNFIMWAWLYQFFLLLSFLCCCSLSHPFLPDLGPQRLFMPLVPFITVLSHLITSCTHLAYTRITYGGQEEESPCQSLQAALRRQCCIYSVYH